VEVTLGAAADQRLGWVRDGIDGSESSGLNGLFGIRMGRNRAVNNMEPIILFLMEGAPSPSCIITGVGLESNWIVEKTWNGLAGTVRAYFGLDS
jgi:hypothetical protein